MVLYIAKQIPLSFGELQKLYLTEEDLRIKVILAPSQNFTVSVFRWLKH